MYISVKRIIDVPRLSVQFYVLLFCLFVFLTLPPVGYMNIFYNSVVIYLVFLRECLGGVLGIALYIHNLSVYWQCHFTRLKEA